jgi:hypothetical protein
MIDAELRRQDEMNKSSQLPLAEPEELSHSRSVEDFDHTITVDDRMSEERPSKPKNSIKTMTIPKVNWQTKTELPNGIPTFF